MRKEYDSSNLPEIKVSYADVLTRSLFYPENEMAKDLAHLMRRKSFTKKEIEYLRAMGFVVNVSVRQVKIPDSCL